MSNTISDFSQGIAPSSSQHVEPPSLQSTFARSLLALPRGGMSAIPSPNRARLEQQEAENRPGRHIDPAGPSIPQMEGIRNMMKEMSFNSFRDFFVKHKELQEDDE